jgi:cell division protein FtsL
MLFIGVLIVIAVAAWSLYPVARVQYQEERNRARLEAELEGLRERNADLRAQVDRLKTPEGVEEVARQDLGLVKEGENLYVVMDSETESATALTNPEPVLDDNAWLQVLDAVFGFDG